MQHVVGLALVVLQAALMGLLSRSVQFPVFVVLLASLGVLTRWRIPLSREQAFLLSAGAAFFFLLKHRFSPHEFPMGTEFIRTHVAFLIAQYLLLIEAAQFIVRREGDELSPVLPALGAVALICIADIQITNQQRTMTQAFAIAYAVLWAVFLWTGRRPMPLPPASDGDQQRRRTNAGTRRRFAAGAVLFSIAATAWIASMGLYELEKKIEGWLISMLSKSHLESSVGFSQSSRLGSVAHKKTEAEKKVAVRVYADEFPGYLRGAVFTRFEASTWTSERRFRGLRDTKPSEFPAGLRPLAETEILHAHPMLQVKPPSEWRYLECWLAEEQESAAFTPLGTTHLIATTDRLALLPYGVFELRKAEESQPYVACLPEEYVSQEMNPPEKDAWRRVPPEYQQSLAELASQIFADAKTDQEKVLAVERYFQQNYRYHLGIEIPSGEDPLLYFLRKKPAAHCEFFASAATLLLRSAGVSARYVTGFVPGEWNPEGKYWIARNRDAHAWTEAYVEPEGWITVEATPGEGVPSAETTATRWAWWETLRSDWRRLRAFLAQNRWDRVWSVLRTSWLGGLVGLFFLAFAGYLVLRIPWHRFGLFRNRRAEKLDPRLAEMQNLLKQMDDLLSPHGLGRVPGETLHQFARRVREWDQWQRPRKSEPTQELPRFADSAAEWYLAYADTRYQGTWDQNTVADLQSRLPTL